MVDILEAGVAEELLACSGTVKTNEQASNYQILWQSYEPWLRFCFFEGRGGVSLFGSFRFAFRFEAVCLTMGKM